MPTLARRLCLLLVALTAVASAQVDVPGLPNQGEPPPPVPTLPNPRATMETFLEAMGQGDLRRTRGTMDLTAISFGLRDTQGNMRARQLLAILDRTRRFRTEDVPDRFDGEPYVFATYHDRAGALIGTVSIARMPDGNWRFTGDTVLAVPDIYAWIRPRPSIMNLTEDEASLLTPGEVARTYFPLAWQRGVLGLQLWQWSMVVGLLVLSILLVPLLRLLVRLVLAIRFKVGRGEVTEASARSLKASLSALVLAYLWLSLLPYIGLPMAVEAFLVVMLRILGGIAVAWLLFAIFDAIIDLAGRFGEGYSARTEHILVPVVRKFGKFVILIGTVLFIATTFDLNVAGVVAGLGIGGLVIALAAKDSVENLFGSLTILFDMPFGIGDWVRIGDIDGVVEEINLRSTRIRTFEDSMVTLPNSNLIKASVENLGQRRFRRVRTNLSLAYHTPPERVQAFCDAVRDLLEAHPRTLKDRLRVSLVNLADSALEVQLYIYFETRDYNEELELRHDLMLEIIRIAQRLEVEFAFPTRTVHLVGGER